MDPEDKRAVLELKERKPTCIGDVRNLLKFLGFYKKCILDFTCCVQLLYDMVKSPKKKSLHANKPMAKIKT
jgi:transposase